MTEKETAVEFAMQLAKELREELQPSKVNLVEAAQKRDRLELLGEIKRLHEKVDALVDRCREKFAKLDAALETLTPSKE